VTIKNKDQIRALLKSIETGEVGAVAVVNEAKYVQHNPHTHEGSEGLADLFLRLSKTNPRVEIVRAFEDGDFVFAHTEYDFADENVGFEVFRFDNGQAVEHWDNIQPRRGPNQSGHSMTDGPTDAADLDRTESNRQTVRAFVDDVLIHRQLTKLGNYADPQSYVEHDPEMEDGFEQLLAGLTRTGVDASTQSYKTIHRVLAEGNFALSMCEGTLGGVHSSFYDLYRLDNGKIVEHWNTVDAIPPRHEWNNNNGKF